MSHAATRAVLPAVAPRNDQRWRADAVFSAVWLSLVVVIGLWVSNRGLADLTGGTATLLNSTGRLTGLIASDLLLVQVLGMARVPWVEQSLGQDRLARLHRLVGFTSFNLMIAHVVLITFGYAALAHRNVLGELWNLVWTYPGMLIATAGTGLLVMVVALSIKAARSRLRYESWHLIHLYGYLGAGLALPHQLWTGSDFLASPLSTLYWWSLYGATLGAVLLFRVGLPLWRSLRHRLEVAAVVKESPGVVSVHLRGHAIDRLPLRAGQFFVWRFLEGPGWSRGHPFSVSAAPHPSFVRITVKDLGDGSSRLATLKPGTKVLIEGPYGRLTAAARTRQKVTLIAAGIGVTPMRALLEELTFAPGDVTFIYRARTKKELIFQSELDALAEQRGARIIYLPGPRASDTSWLPKDLRHLDDAEALRLMVPDLARNDVFVCGPNAWMDSVRLAARAVGVPAPNIHEERFSW
ncbi:MAG: hypothetical protein QOJ90_1876 [Actinomycetota bacterium]|jgi:predicted ferric reductase|nr:hypothetical protein [Actinomycetota bacterium]